MVSHIYWNKKKSDYIFEVITYATIHITNLLQLGGDCKLYSTQYKKSKGRRNNILQTTSHLFTIEDFLQF